MKIILLAALALILLGCSDDSAKSSVKEKIEKQVNKSVDSVKEVKKATTEAVETAVAEVKDTTAEVVAQVSPAKSGADLFKACSSCHGQSGEKKALNKSKAIQGWGEAQVAASLNGYKDGSYGGVMKGLMKSQVTKLSDEDISALSKYISEL